MLPPLRDEAPTLLLSRAGVSELFYLVAYHAFDLSGACRVCRCVRRAPALAGGGPIGPEWRHMRTSRVGGGVLQVLLGLGCGCFAGVWKIVLLLWM